MDQTPANSAANLRAAALQAVLDATTLDAAQAPGAHDAVVIGAGAAGGLAALLLTEAGLRVLVLDAGKPRRAAGASQRPRAGLLQHLAGPAGLKLIPRPLIRLGRAALRALGAWRQPIQSQSAAWARSPKGFVDDRDCPYVTPPGRSFLWLRARQLGGRMALAGHGRQYYRLGPDDLTSGDGLSPPWPLATGELDGWYDKVEARLELSGMVDGCRGSPTPV
jgi:choline dehydrogenase-like flavoprotein